MPSVGRYSRYVAGPLSEDALKRLRLATKLRRCINQPSLSERYRIGYLAKLIRAIEPPPNPADRNLWDWLYCYSGPEVLRRLLRDGAGSLLPHVEIKLRDADALNHLLPQEHFTPEFQVYTKAAGRRTLVCFTGNALKLNVPVQLFHLLALDWFDSVIYLRDTQRQFFTRGISGLASSFEALTELIGQHLRPGAEVSVLGTSSGGYPAIRYAQRAQARRVALFSPPMFFRNVSALDHRRLIDANNVRLYFADSCKADARFRSSWEETDYRSSVHMIATTSHSTFSDLLTKGGTDEMFAWLSQSTQSLAGRAA